MTLTKTQLSALSYLARFQDGQWYCVHDIPTDTTCVLPPLVELTRMGEFIRITAAGRQALARATGADKIRAGETAAQYASRNCATIAAMVRWAESKGE